MMADVRRLNREAIFADLPDIWQADLMPAIREQIARINAKVIVLDDDPTGTQTVHDVTVLTTWTVDVLQGVLEDVSPASFVLTNTRSMTALQAEKANREIAENLKIASRKTGRDFVIVSRSDSTLRGHFPLETDVLASTLNYRFNAVLMMPAFMAGGRYTINGMHYVAEGDELIPASETAFAQDAVFGYQHADLCHWVAEKTNKRIKPDEVALITIDEIRDGGVETVKSRLLLLENSTYCVIDAITERDIEVVTLAILQAEAEDKKFLYRTAASFAAIRSGIPLRSLLSPDELQTNRSGGGLIVVGSYVPKSSSQLSHLLESKQVVGLEVNVRRLLKNSSKQIEISGVVEKAISLLQSGRNVTIYTSRELITGDDAESSLSIGNIISDSLVQITKQLQSHARYVIAKGGITSSDLATKALQVNQAKVIGQILPGIPVWQLDENCAEPDLIYVVFPGNVGDADSMSKAVAKFNKG